jgi:hypothetical protein
MNVVEKEVALLYVLDNLLFLFIIRNFTLKREFKILYLKQTMPFGYKSKYLRVDFI